jgi:hypothetical protein
VCGDGVVAIPETCDPPGSATLPNGHPCRDTCTYCGDGKVQLSGGESCDDGNSVSGCRPDQPQKPLDGCLNNCQRPLCDDPSKIKLFDEATTGKKDLIKVHGRLITTVPVDPDLFGFGIEILKRDCRPGMPCDVVTVFGEEVPSVPGGVNPLHFKYKNKLAKTEGGLFLVKIVSKMSYSRCAGGPADDTPCRIGISCPGFADCVGYYKFLVKAYGEAGGAQQEMQTEISIGNDTWAVRALWEKLKSGWKLDKKAVFLDPWISP